MSRHFQCDLCGKLLKTNYDDNYPKDWFLVKLYSKPQKLMKGEHGIGYHVCRKCKIKVFDKKKKELEE